MKFFPCCELYEELQLYPTWKSVSLEDNEEIAPYTLFYTQQETGRVTVRGQEMSPVHSPACTDHNPLCEVAAY
jgi:hypothetical protein